MVGVDKACKGGLRGCQDSLWNLEVKPVVSQRMGRLPGKWVLECHQPWLHSSKCVFYSGMEVQTYKQWIWSLIGQRGWVDNRDQPCVQLNQFNCKCRQERTMFSISFRSWGRTWLQAGQRRCYNCILEKRFLCFLVHLWDEPYLWRTGYLGVTDCSVQGQN